jgi:predicted AAA+ superfamily ATPase
VDRLSQVNPWWFPDQGFGPRLPGRDLEVPVRNALLNPEGEPGVLLVGFRRVGKTVLARQILRHFHEERGVPVENLLYVDFQEDSFSDLSPIDILRHLLARRDPVHPTCIVFDEIQFLPEWDKKLRTVLHAVRKPDVHVLATGSSAVSLRRATGDVLLDRARFMRLSPMLLSEWLRMSGAGNALRGAPLHDAFARYAVSGGFPGLLGEESDVEKRRRLRELCERRVIDGDLLHRLGIRQRNTFGRVWRHLVCHPGATLDWTSIGNEFDTTRETLEGWVEALKQAEMIRELRPSTPGGEVEEGRGRYSRVFPIDHALCGAYGVPVDGGGGMEAMVLSHLAALHDALQSAGQVPHLTYWLDRKAGGPNEIDLRLESREVSLLIEVKGAEDPVGERITRVAKVAARLGHARCILVHGGVERRVDRKMVGKDAIDVHLWPAPEFLLTLSTCETDAEALFR